MENIVIVGAGGFGREVAWLIERINLKKRIWHILGFVDDNYQLFKKLDNEYPLLGDLDYLLSCTEKINVVCAIGCSETRRKVIQKISNNQNLFFPSLIDPNAVIGKNIIIGKGTIICANSIATVNVSIGNYVIVNLSCTLGHESVISDYCTIYPSANISGAVSIGCCTEIGTGTQIIQGKSIGRNTIIGAGSVVIRDIESNCTAVGIPAKKIKQRDS